MSEKIYVMNEKEGTFKSLEEKRFSTEDHLQSLIADHPELLAGDQMRPDEPLRWILVTREKGISETPDSSYRWSVDHLLIDQNAIPTLVEVKRGESGEIRRAIVGQMLDYAAHATGTWSVEEVRDAFEKTTIERGDDPGNVLSKLLESGGEPNADKFWDDVSKNLDAKRLRLLFVADEIPDELARIVEFLNEQMLNIEVLAVEIKQYPGEFLHALVPRVIGRMTNPPARGSQRRSLRRDEFLERFANREVRQAAVRMLDSCSDNGAVFEWGSKGVSIRVDCSLWNQPITVAWLYPTPGIGWSATKNFSFGAGNGNGNGHVFGMELPDNLEMLLKNWADQFKDDEFAEDASSTGVIAHSINHDNAVEHIDLLCDRLGRVISDLRAL